MKYENESPKKTIISKFPNTASVVSRIILISLLLYIILEAVRLAFLYSTVVTASRQAVRYGSATGGGIVDVLRYQDCAGIRAAAEKADIFNAFDDNDIIIQYDSGPDTTTYSYCTGSPLPSSDTSFQPRSNNTSRIIVTINGNFHPLIPILVPAIKHTTTATSARTVLVSVSIEVTSPPPLTSIAPTTVSNDISVAQQLAKIDETLRQGLSASIAYNVPKIMKLDEATTIELLLNPAVSPEVLSTQITESGQVVIGSVDITPRVKAVLIAQEQDAFDIQPVQDDPEQVISGIDTTKWSWFVTAKKAGVHRLTMVIYRLVKFEDQDYWREVEAYKADIDVKITFAQRMQAIDWKWIAGIVITLVAIPAFWRWYDQRNKKPEQLEKSRQKKPGNENLGNIFISYRRSDSADIVGRIYDRLIDEFGRNSIFKDVDSIPFGIDFKEYLDKRVSECNVLLAVIGDRWADANDATGKKRLEDSSDFVRIEIESALESGIPVIPLLVRGAQMPAEEKLPSGLRKLVYKNGIQIRPDPDFHRDMDRLISALEKYVR